MGIDLVQLVLLHHAADLSGRAFKVLCKMAATALDTPNGRGQPPRLYFAGEGPLAHVLYGRGLELHTPEGDEVYSANELREVRRVVKELRDAGLIEPTMAQAGRHRGRQSWRLNLGQIAHPSEGESAHPSEGESAHPSEGESAPPAMGKLPSPRTHRGLSEDLSQDSTTHPAASTTGSGLEAAS